LLPARGGGCQNQHSSTVKEPARRRKRSLSCEGASSWGRRFRLPTDYLLPPDALSLRQSLRQPPMRIQHFDH
jgi:hypothetical protein